MFFIIITISKDSIFLLFLPYVDIFTINQHSSSYQAPLTQERQDCIYKHDMEWLETVHNLEEELTRSGHRLNCGKPW